MIRREAQLLTDLKDFLSRAGGVGGAAKRLNDSFLLAGSRYPALRRKLGLHRFGGEMKVTPAPLVGPPGEDPTNEPRAHSQTKCSTASESMKWLLVTLPVAAVKPMWAGKGTRAATVSSM